jgi:nitroreductase
MTAPPSITPAHLLHLMATRRSVRDYRRDPVPRAEVMALLEAAVTAPSASNKQPWRFFVVDDAPRLDAMARAVQSRLDELLARIPPELHAQVHDYGRYFVRFAAAPVVIAVAYRPLAVLSHLLAQAGGAPAAMVAAVDGMEHHSSVVSASLAVQNLMLQARAMGLGSSCLAGPLIAADALAAHCRISAGWSLACLVAVGYAADEAASSPGRKDASSVVRWVSDHPFDHPSDNAFETAIDATRDTAADPMPP